MLPLNKRGIEERIKSAFPMPMRRAPLLPLRVMIAFLLSVLPAFGTPQDLSSAHAGGSWRWLVVVLNVASVACFVLWWQWQWIRSRIPKRAQHEDSLALVPMDEGDETLWKARALAAEARAAKATALLKARMMPQLARWMMGELLQKLMHQRNDILTSQQRAEQEVEELERRLEKLHAPLEERLRAYERRIAELEKELAAKGDENRELIKAKIETARKRLESERAKPSVSWN